MLVRRISLSPSREFFTDYQAETGARAQTSIANSIQFGSKANYLEFSRETANPSQGEAREKEVGRERIFSGEESRGNFENALNLKAFICNRIITRAGLR